MDQVALYYPYMTPPEDWIRRSLFLFDGISTIVPPYGPPRTANVLRWLADEGVWRPSYAQVLDSFVDSQSYVSEIQDVLLEYAVKSHHDVSGTGQVNIAAGKLMYFVAEALRDLDLLQVPADDYNDEGLFVPQEVGAIILAVTAKHLAAASNFRMRARMVTSTDIPVSRLHAYDPVKRTTDRYRCGEILLDGLIPVPDERTDLSDIIEFRVRHMDELHRMRAALDSFVDAITESPDPVDQCARSRQTIESAVRDLEKAAHSRRIALTTGALGILVGGYGARQGLSFDDMNLLFQGIGGSVVVAAGQHLLRRKPGPEGNPFDYLVRVRGAYGAH